MSNTNVRGTSDMPTPQTMNYQASYKISQLFVNDFRRTFQEISYADYKNLERYISRDVIPAALLNELIRTIATYPYKYVAGLMRALENKETFKKYFELLPQPSQC